MYLSANIICANQFKMSSSGKCCPFSLHFLMCVDKSPSCEPTTAIFHNYYQVVGLYERLNVLNDMNVLQIAQQIGFLESALSFTFAEYSDWDLFGNELLSCERVFDQINLACSSNRSFRCRLAECLCKAIVLLLEALSCCVLIIRALF